MEENVIQIKSGTMVNVDVSAKIIYVEKIIFGILIQVVAKMVNIQHIFFGDDILIIFEEILDVRLKSFDEETKTVSTNFSEKEVASKIKKFYILLGF